MTGTLKKNLKSKSSRNASRKSIDAFIGNRIRTIRNLRGMRQKVLGSSLVPQISQQQICKYENGNDSVSASMLFEISQILGVTVESFMPIDLRPSIAVEVSAPTLNKALYKALDSFKKTANISEKEYLQLEKTLKELYKAT